MEERSRHRAKSEDLRKCTVKMASFIGKSRCGKKEVTLRTKGI